MRATILNHKIQNYFISPFLRMLPVSDMLRLEKETEMEMIRRIQRRMDGARIAPDYYVIRMHYKGYRACEARLPLYSEKLAGHLRECMRREGLRATGRKISVVFEACAYVEKRDVLVNGFFSGDENSTAEEAPVSWYVYSRENARAGIFIDHPGEFLIGRDEICKIGIDSPYVSNRHAMIIASKNGKLYVRDLGSRNGTFVNGVPVHGETGVALERGDILRIGKTSGKTLVIR